jgi:ATP-dependent protease ClpP protease subunit
MKEVIMPIDMVISTPGGNADDMFAIYDTMRSSVTRCLLKPEASAK